jgi:hypothetical protein
MAMPEMRQLLSLYRRSARVGFASNAAAGDPVGSTHGSTEPGSSGASRCLHVLVPPFQTELPPPAPELQQKGQEAVPQLQLETVILQEGEDGAGGGEVAIRGPDGSAGGRPRLSAVEDDGVRLLASLGQLSRHTAIAERILQSLDVPYVVLRERDRDGRREELLGILADVGIEP